MTTSEAATDPGPHKAGALLLLTLLFVLLGVAVGFNQLLLPYLAQVYGLRASELVPWHRAYWVASLLVAVPAGWAVARLGYGRGLAGGLLALAGGGLLLSATVSGWGFGLAVVALALLGAGDTVLHVAALPYLTSLVSGRWAAVRLTWVSAAQMLGSTLLPLLSGLLLGGKLGVAQLAGPYLGLAVGLLAGAVLVQWGPLAVKLPEAELADAGGPASVWGSRRLWLGTLAVFVCAGGQAGLSTLFIPFGQSLQLTHLSGFTVARLQELTEGFNVVLRASGQPAAPLIPAEAGFTLAVGAALLFAYQLLGLVGRLVGWPLLLLLPGRTVLAAGAATGAVLVAAAVVSKGDSALWLLVASGLAHALLWPVAVSLALTGLGRFAPLGAGLLVLAAVLGTGMTLPLLGWLAGHGGWHFAFGVLVAGYGYLIYYALYGSNQDPGPSSGGVGTGH